VTASAELYGPQTLYRHWEHEQWNPWSIELASDREQWQTALDETDKRLVYWALSSLRSRRSGSRPSSRAW
jgi:ribonucleotide reductase beta subunit family protein with ferritin-like domain